MKIKEMKEKGIEFVKEHEVEIAFGGAAFIYGVGMYLWGRIDGCKVGKNQAIRTFARDIYIGQFTRELEVDPGKYILDRFFNNDLLNGKINSFSKAVELLGDPENTKDVVGMVVVTKKN